MADLGDTMKKVILAGIGAAAETTEKAQAMLDDMVKKGELTIEQGKVLNQELKHDVKEKWNSTREEASKKAAQKDLSDILKDMSTEDLKALKAKLDALDLDDEVKEDEDI